MTSFTEGINEAFDRCGTPQDMRTVEGDFYLEAVTVPVRTPITDPSELKTEKRDGLTFVVPETDERQTQFFIIPKQIFYQDRITEQGQDPPKAIPAPKRAYNPEETYYLTPEGSVISPRATIRVNANLNLGPRTVIGHTAVISTALTAGRECLVNGIVDNATLGDHVRLARDSSVKPNCNIGSYSRIGEGTAIDEGAILRKVVIVGDKARIGTRTTIGGGSSIDHHAVVGADVQTGANLTLGRSARVDGHTTIGEKVAIGPGTMIGVRTKIGDKVRIEHSVTCKDDSTIDTGARILEGSTTKPGQTVNTNAIVYLDGNRTKIVNRKVL